MMQAQKEKQQAAGLVFDFKYCNAQWEIFNDFFSLKNFQFLMILRKNHKFGFFDTLTNAKS